MSEVKSGHELLEDFFVSLEAQKDLDRDVVRVLSELYKQGKLTSTNISNALESLRESIKADGKTK